MSEERSVAVCESKEKRGIGVTEKCESYGEKNSVTEETGGGYIEEGMRCSSCGEDITGEIFTDRFYELLCRRCLIRLHKI